MPILMWIFIGAQAMAHGPNLVSSLTKGRDPMVRLKTSKTPITYQVTTAPWYDAVEDRNGGCDFQFIARTTGRTPMRARIDGWEQILDTCWTERHRIEAGKRADIKVEFVEPIDGSTTAKRSVSFTCRKARLPTANSLWEQERRKKW